MRALGSLAITLAVLASACASRVPGRLLHVATNPPLVGQPLPYTLAVDAVTDERPEPERTGLGPETTLFIFLLFYIHISERGNLVTSPIELGRFPMADLRQLTVDYLTRSRVFRDVGAAPRPADFVLRQRVHHLFAARFVGSSFSAAWSRDSSSAHSSAAQFAPFGNAVVTYELVDRRGGKNEVVWRDTLSGYSVGEPASPKYKPLPGIAVSATASLLGRLARALHLGIEQLAAQERPALAPVPVAPGFRFNVQRTSPTRTEVEVLTLEYPGGLVASTRTIQADSLPPGRPGDWLLSRRLPTGELVRGARYDAMARSLARSFDLRRVDDARYYHFFGLRGAQRRALPGAPPPGPPPPPPVQ